MSWVSRMSVGVIASAVSFYHWYQANEAKHPAHGRHAVAAGKK